MKRLIKSIPVANGELRVISAGQRRPLAHFTGRVEIIEDTKTVPLLGTMQTGMKTVYASFIVCGGIDYHCKLDDSFIHSGKIYEATADVNNEIIDFAGLRFEDSNPMENELTFSINDLELVEKLLKQS